MNHQGTLGWMRDLMEHLVDCHDQCQHVDPGASRYLIEAMRRDLEELRRLCESLRQTTAPERLLPTAD